MSEWRILPDYIDGRKFFSIYRKLDSGYIDSEQNREYYRRFMKQEDAYELLEALNDAEMFLEGEL